MESDRRTRAQQRARSEHFEAAMFLHEIVATGDSLRVARDFAGRHALHYDRESELLRAIERCGGGPTFSDLGRHMKMSRVSARALAVAAERAQLVELLPEHGDRRTVQVVLAPMGQKLLEQDRLPATSWIFMLLAGLEPAAMRSTAHVLHVLRRRLESYEKEWVRSTQRRGRT